MTDSRFLFLLYYYPPVIGTAAKRNFRISNAISEHASSFIFTSSSITRDVISSDQVRIKTIPAFDYRNILRRQTIDGALPENNKKGAATQWLIRLINTFPVNILAGEGGLIYFLNLLREGRKAVRQGNITHLYSSYRPFADHYAAYWLKKWNPQLYWIADFRDLIIDPHYNHILYPKSHQAFFRKIFGNADLLTTVSDGLASHLRDFNKNVVTLRNGVSASMQQPIPVFSDTFTIAYTGSMFLDKRNAAPLFHAIRELIQEVKIDAADIRIVYAGKDGAVWKQLARQNSFESLLDDKGIVTSEDAFNIQQEACINLLLTVSSDQLQGVLTGKMIEYVESGSPVLGIVVGQNDPELQTILQELEIGDSFSDQPESLQQIKEFIRTEYTHWKTSGSNRKPVNMNIVSKKYTMDVVMMPLFDKLNVVPLS